MRDRPTLAPTKWTDSYKSGQVWAAINAGKTPCEACWKPGGYDALADPIAALWS